MATTRKRPSELFLLSGSDYSIRNEVGETVSLEEAKHLWESGCVTNCNMAFNRLVQFGFDVNAVKSHYAAYLC